MTIKQQGGIFGRNPTFNDVTVDGDLVVDGGITVPADSISGDAIDGGTPTTDGITLQSASSPIQLKDASDVRRWLIQKGADDLFFYRYNTSGGYAGNPLTINSTTGLSTFEGNIKMKTAGTGIDFSATSGTGTSELFDDYEEGSFTPTLTTDGTDFSSVTYDAAVFGSYTKVGNVVHIQLLMQTDAVTKGSASGNVIIGGLPFTADGTSPLAVATSKDWLANHPTRAYVADGATTISLLTNANNTADDSTVVVADVKTLGNDNTLRLAGTYRAS